MGPPYGLLPTWCALASPYPLGYWLFSPVDYSQLIFVSECARGTRTSMARAYYVAYWYESPNSSSTEFLVTGPLPVTQKATQPPMKKLTFRGGARRAASNQR